MWYSKLRYHVLIGLVILCLVLAYCQHLGTL